MKRNRLFYFTLIVLTIGIGLASRRYACYLPDFVNLGLGDALWALMIYWIVGFIMPRSNIKRLVAISLSICFLVEFSQLIQVEWLNQIRNTRLGALVLGRGFLWSDLFAYSIGVLAGMIFESLGKYRKKKRGSTYISK